MIERWGVMASGRQRYKAIGLEKVWRDREWWGIIGHSGV